MPADDLKTWVQHILPQHGLSRLMGKLTECQIPWLKNWLIDKFIRTYGVEMAEAVEPNPHAYPNFNSFFTRALQPAARPIVQDARAIACPVDGTVSQAGVINAGDLLQAKGFNYSVEQLLGGSAARAAPFMEGHFATFYLAPKDYHRVHMPLTGQLREMVYVPGRLFSVNARTTDRVPNLFARNERVVALFDTAIGPMAVILVGAMLVASIRTVWAGVVAPQLVGPRSWQYCDQHIALTRGDEMGHFALGSTVIVLFAPNSMTWETEIQPGQTVRLGQLLGKWRN